jgi:hypothetical protein
MSRHRTAKSVGHRVKLVGPDHYRLSWVVDFYYPSSTLRYPRMFHRDTDYAGAVRFAKRWRIDAPPSPHCGHA